MNMSTPHTFHIPVMGLGYTIDTPVKIAHFGISSVISIIQDVIIEEMRKHYCSVEGEPYIPIPKDDIDHRAKRVCSYLNLVSRIVKRNTQQLKCEEFVPGSGITKYFTLLPGNSLLKRRYQQMVETKDLSIRKQLQEELRNEITPGDIDVNIMTKLDNVNYDKEGNELPAEYTDAVSALRGFAQSELNSSVVFSAGMNPRLFAFCEQVDDFFPDEQNDLKKRIILKVSDYRSALIQGRFLAKKGLWISEFRIESGLNCGGHAFPTEGLLLGPILEEFIQKREELASELFTMCQDSLKQKNRTLFLQAPVIKITAQGGIGTSAEHNLLLQYYKMDSVGWGSPFLMVPEATNVDERTLEQLVSAKKEDYFLSHASPLGVPFNNFRRSSSEEQRLERIRKGRPGSPCYKKYLSFNTEFTGRPICVASRQYQDLKLKQLVAKEETEGEFVKDRQLVEEVLAKDCLCEGLAASVLLKNKIKPEHGLTAVSICPGPNLAYFSGVFALEEMVGHIYGRNNLLNTSHRPHVFINELEMYVEYLKAEITRNLGTINPKKTKYFNSFKGNLLEGIRYYKDLVSQIKFGTDQARSQFEWQLNGFETEISAIDVPHASTPS